MTVDEVGTVIKVGDGIAEIYGLEKVMAASCWSFRTASAASPQP
jgi:F0F1-type ATP synthase alpha subunit